jgi:hypothetical protein
LDLSHGEEFAMVDLASLAVRRKPTTMMEPSRIMGDGGSERRPPW